MDNCDVLITGGGPAGSSCAWALRGSGLDIVVVDRARFPRDKICGGWITPAVMTELQINAAEYSASRVLQPITGFRTSIMGRRPVETTYGRAVSYGVRRCEFDDYLLARSAARVFQGCAVSRIERSGDHWIINDQIRTKLLVGAGGHFCPVARFLGARHGSEPIVAAQEIEFQLNERQSAACAVVPEIPELMFCPDMKGYGWCFRKGAFLNVGLGRMDRHRLAAHVDAFVAWLKRCGRIPPDSPSALPGHAYLLYGFGGRASVCDGGLLVGDAAGLAYPESGEGIRPAVESGLIAAGVILEAEGDYSAATLGRYRDRLRTRFTGSGAERFARRGAGLLPQWVVRGAAQTLMSTGWFSRRVLLDSWFLHAQQAPLESI